MHVIALSIWKVTEDNGRHLFVPIAAKWLAWETDDDDDGDDDDDDDADG